MNEEKKLREKIKQLEKELHSQKYFFESILSVMPGHIYWMDLDNRFLGCNEQQALDAGLSSSKDIVGKKNIDLPWKEQAQELDKANLEVMKTGKPLKKEEKALAGNKIHNYITEKIAIRDEENNISGLVGISIDITELTEREQQLAIATKKAEAANRAKAEFIANMSHDIRTPLTGIIGLANMVESESHEEEIKEYAHMLNISGEQLLSLLNSVLDIVASDTIGKKALRPSVFNLEDLFQNIFELELPSLQLKSIDFKLDMDKDLPQFIESDKEKIYRIVLNILSNAIKFTHDGSITIKATKINQKNDNTITKIQIIDTGIGIPKEDISKVFDQFYRATPSHEGNFDGYGVGLHIVQKYLKLLKGEVLVESEVGKGTCISLTLPLKKASMPESYVKPESPVSEDCSDTKTKPAQTAKPEIIKNPRATVLLVEDNMMARTVAKTMLTKANCQVFDAENSTDAFNLFKGHRFDFVLTDIGLPDYSGLELAKQMRKFELEQDKEKTPVIALSGHEDSENLAAYEFKYGLAGMYTKPLRNEELNEIIELYGKKDASQSDSSSNTPVPTNEPLGEPLLDEALAIKQVGSYEMVREMAQMMLDDAFVKITPEIDEHFKSQDWPAFKAKVHKFKSSCLYCATTPLLKLVEQLESLADGQNIDEIGPVYEQFLTCADDTKQYIKNWLGA